MKKLGEWDYYGACDPAHYNVPAGFMGHETFSVGIFRWVPKSGPGLKRGRIVARVSGLTSDPESVYQQARAKIAELNAHA